MPHQQRANKPKQHRAAGRAAVTCTACGAVIPDAVFRQRKRAPREHNFCSKDCVHDWQRATGHYKAMSEKGRDARIAAVAKSNSEQPRRHKDKR